MLALIITLVPTVNAESYISDDTVVISSQYHDLFNNYFDGKSSYQYFPYNCDIGYSRTCYFGIDKNGNYLKVYYIRFGTSYEQKIETGKDENFSVSGNNIIKKDVDYTYTILILSVFVLVFLLFLRMW